MFPDNDIAIASKMENSMSIQPAEKSEVGFNGNQYLGDGKIIGMPKVCQNKHKLA